MLGLNLLNILIKLKVHSFDTRKEMGVFAASEAAECIKKLIGERGNIRMIFAAAPSQNEFLEALISERDIDWSKIDKNDYLLAMERSPIKDTEIKVLIKDALTDKTNDREVYMKGIDVSYNYEGYNTYKLIDLS